jgi:hypothetical protein
MDCTDVSRLVLSTTPPEIDDLTDMLHHAEKCQHCRDLLNRHKPNPEQWAALRKDLEKLHSGSGPQEQ